MADLLFHSSPSKRTTMHFAPYRYGAAPSLNRAFAAVQELAPL
jgi:hypothetical protein